MAGSLGLGGRHEGEVLDDLLGVLGLAGARLSGAEDALILTVCNNVVSLQLRAINIDNKHNQRYSLLINEKSDVLI